MVYFRSDFFLKENILNLTVQYLEKYSESESCSVLSDSFRPHGILQARILEWVLPFPFSRGSSQPRDRTQDTHIAGRFFTSWATKEAQEY